MIRQKGYIDLDGFFAIIACLAIFGVFGIFYWGIPSLWIWIKPFLHMVST